MGYRPHMRLHIEIDDAIVDEIDRIGGPRGRSAFVRRAVERALQSAVMLERLERAAGAIDDRGHEWDGDPSAWVRANRRGDPRRAG